MYQLRDTKNDKSKRSTGICKEGWVINFCKLKSIFSSLHFFLIIKRCVSTKGQLNRTWSEVSSHWHPKRHCLDSARLILWSQERNGARLTARQLNITASNHVWKVLEGIHVFYGLEKARIWPNEIFVQSYMPWKHLIYKFRKSKFSTFSCWNLAPNSI